VLNAGTTIGGSQPGAGGCARQRGHHAETQIETEPGPDIQFLNNRMQFEGTVYSRKITTCCFNRRTIPSGGIAN